MTETAFKCLDCPQKFPDYMTGCQHVIDTFHRVVNHTKTTKRGRK